MKEEIQMSVADWLIAVFDTENFRVLATAVGVADCKQQRVRIVRAVDSGR
jgi:hypothetical protein